MSLFSSLSCFSIKSLSDIFGASFFFPLDLKEFFAPLVDDRLESCIFLFSLTLHPQLHQFFVLLSLQVLHSFVDGHLVGQFVNINVAFSAFGNQLGLERTSFELLVIEFPFEFLSLFFSSISFMSESLDRVNVLLSFSLVNRRTTHRGLESTFFLKVILLFLHPHPVSLLLSGCFRLG